MLLVKWPIPIIGKLADNRCTSSVVLIHLSDLFYSNSSTLLDLMNIILFKHCQTILDNDNKGYWS